MFINSSATGTQNNFAPTGWDTCDGLIWSGASDVTVTGFEAPTASGKRRKTLVCASSTNDFLMTAEDAGSSAANRILGTSVALSILQGNQRAMDIVYDDTNSRWRLVFAAAS